MPNQMNFRFNSPSPHLYSVIFVDFFRLRIHRGINESNP